MACKIERPEPQALFNRYLNLFSNTVLGGAEVIPESNEWYATSVNYAIAEEFYAIAEQAWKERDPREACCDNLIAMARENGVYPRPALAAQGYIRITGTAGADLPAPLEFSAGDQTFVTAVASEQPTAIGDDGTATIRVRALVPGEAGNLTNEESATLNTTVANVEREAEVCGSTFCEGADAESCEQFRTRYLNRLAYQPRATNAWLLDKMLEWPCATRALQREGSCCRCGCAGGNFPEDCEQCGCKDCGGQLAFYLMFDNTFDCGIAPESVIEEAEAWLFGSPQGYGLGQVEVGVCGRIAPVTGVQINVILDIAACPTATQLTQIRDTIDEFFTTLEPSKPLRLRTIESVLSNVLGADTNYAARLELVNPDEGYGDGRARTDDSKVFVGNCDLEPDCDVLLCLNELTILRPGDTQVECS